MNWCLKKWNNFSKWYCSINIFLTINPEIVNRSFKISLSMFSKKSNIGKNVWQISEILKQKIMWYFWIIISNYFSKSEELVTSAFSVFSNRKSSNANIRNPSVVSTRFSSLSTSTGFSEFSAQTTGYLYCKLISSS